MVSFGADSMLGDATAGGRSRARVLRNRAAVLHGADLGAQGVHVGGSYHAIGHLGSEEPGIGLGLLAQVRFW